MHVDAMGVANHAPLPDDPHFSEKPPGLTVEMVVPLQGWDDQTDWVFAGRKTAQYRQIGNAFPPPLAEAVRRSIRAALDHETEIEGAREIAERSIHDDVYCALREAEEYLALEDLLARLTQPYALPDLEKRIANLDKDFVN